MPPIVTLTMNPALDIATATEAVMPTVKLRCDEPRYDPGGGGINVARAVSLLGGDALAVFPVGGLSGEMLCRLLSDEGVPHDAVPIAGPTRESLAVIERQSGKQYRFLLPGPTLGYHDRRRCLDVLASHLLGAGYLVASGSLPPGVPADFYAEVGALARQHGVRFVLDTSGPALAGTGTGIYLLKTSLRELEELTGHRLATMADQGRAAREVIVSGRAQILVVSLGERGALLAMATDTRRFEAIKVGAVGSVGAGDSMVAGMILSLARGWTLIEALKLGMAAGAAALLRPGTELCCREDTERLYRTLAT
ncbi:MAG TPA: 1-phosphofructokinase family hexose kinase [Stellaceae bacterium]|nr:1-phosphofructokinase family hexose kinase [Stellaceae bacterium]